VNEEKTQSTVVTYTVIGILQCFTQRLEIELSESMIIVMTKIRIDLQANHGKRS
jgi:hypothetical protein